MFIIFESAEIDQIYESFIPSKNIVSSPSNPMAVYRVRWELIQRVFVRCVRNVSKTARKLRMCRITLQRILNKRDPRE